MSHLGSCPEPVLLQFLALSTSQPLNPPLSVTLSQRSRTTSPKWEGHLLLLTRTPQLLLGGHWALRQPAGESGRRCVSLMRATAHTALGVPPTLEGFN